MKRLLIANRGKIAIRIARSAADLGLASVAVFSEDDALALHVRTCDQALPLRGQGPAPYLDAEQLVAAALASGCDALHPGYGFLSENADFARRCADAGLVFVGLESATLAALGDKAQARALAVAAGVPVMEGTAQATMQDEAQAFFTKLGAGAGMMIKAVAGGGWARHAGGAVGRWHRVRQGLVPGRGAAGLRQRRAVRGTLVPTRPPHRGAGDGRRQRRGQPFVGA